MRSRTRSNAISACLITLLAVAALAYLGGRNVDADEFFEFEHQLKEPFGKKLVKGAPFSAQTVVEITQTLSNGVQLEKKMSGALYRDSEGRTRQEFMREDAPEMVVINDRIAGVFYHLHVAKHLASKSTINNQVHLEWEEHHRREIEDRRRKEEIHRKHEEMERAKAHALKHEHKEIEPERRVESLGLRTLDGIQAEVTRLTTTIPAGSEGNDRAFDVVSERWFSPELQMVVFAKRIDPRAGEMVYKLININRSEPARSLFEPPADYTVVEEKDLEIQKEKRLKRKS